MTTLPPNSQFIFALFELARLIRLHADHKARPLGITRAQWAVLAKLERTEGLKQSELAELLEMQPITLTRQIDRLCDSGLIERRSDASDRRAKRLYLLPSARALLVRLAALRGEITETALSGLDAAAAERLVVQLETIKDNVRNAIQGGPATAALEERNRRHG